MPLLIGQHRQEADNSIIQSRGLFVCGFSSGFDMWMTLSISLQTPHQHLVLYPWARPNQLVLYPRARPNLLVPYPLARQILMVTVPWAKTGPGPGPSASRTGGGRPESRPCIEAPSFPPIVPANPSRVTPRVPTEPVTRGLCMLDSQLSCVTIPRHPLQPWRSDCSVGNLAAEWRPSDSGVPAWGWQISLFDLERLMQDLCRPRRGVGATEPDALMTAGSQRAESASTVHGAN